MPRAHGGTSLRRAGRGAVLWRGLLGTVTLVVYNQVQLTELTEQINTAAKQLGRRPKAWKSS